PRSPRPSRVRSGFRISAPLLDDAMEAPLPPPSLNLRPPESADKGATNLRTGVRDTAAAGTLRSVARDVDRPRRIPFRRGRSPVSGADLAPSAGHRHRPDGSLVTVRAGRDGERAESLLHRRG